MKKSIRYCCISVIFAIVFAIIVFLLLTCGVLWLNKHHLPFFFVMITLLSAALFIAVMRMSCCIKERDSYCSCGHLSLIGGIGTLLLAFLLFFSCSYPGIFYFLGLAILFFFFTLQIASLIAYLFSGFGCSSGCQYERKECNADNDFRDRDGEYRRRDYHYSSHK